MQAPTLLTMTSSKGFQGAAAATIIEITNGIGTRDRFATSTIANNDKYPIHLVLERVKHQIEHPVYNSTG